MDYFNNFSLFITKLFKSKFIGFIAIVFSIFFFNPLDSYAYFGEGNAVEFADVSGNVISSFNYDYNVNVYVENCKYIYMYFDTKTIRNENYNLFVDFGYTYNRPYSIGFNVLNMFQDEIPVTNFNARVFNPEGQPDGATSYFNRYHLDLDFTSVATKGHVRITIELPDVLNIYFYSVYNRYLSGPEYDDVGNNDIIENQNQNTDKIIENQNQNTDKITDTIDDLNDNLFDDEPLSDSAIEDFFDDIGADFVSDTPISDLILMPFTLLNSYTNGISGTCTSFDLGSLLGTNLIMPCVDLESILGSEIWTLIDSLISIFMIYNIAMLVISIFDSVTSLDDTFQLLYTPVHGNLSRVGRGHSRGLY